MNHLILTGMVATTPVFVPTEAGSVLTFRLYHQHTDDNQKSSWLKACVFGIMADEAYTTIGRGDKVRLTGEMIARDWDNGQYSGTEVEIKVSSYIIEEKWSYKKPQPETHSCDCDKCDRNVAVA